MPKYSQKSEGDVFVQACLAQMDASRDWFVTSILPRSLDQLRWRPEIGAWSILDYLSHLQHTFEYYVPRIEQAVQKQPQRLGRVVAGAAFLESEAEFLKQAEPPAETAFTTPPSFPRVAAASPDRIVDQFPQLRGRYSTALRIASELDLANIAVEGSMHPPIRSLGGIVALLAAYDRLHIWQAERVRRAPGFPIAVPGTHSEEESRG